MRLPFFMRLLTSLISRAQAGNDSLVPPPALAIDGLPLDICEVLPGLTYALLLPDGDDWRTLLADTIESNCLAGRHIALFDADAGRMRHVLDARLTASAETWVQQASLFLYSTRQSDSLSLNIWTFLRELEQERIQDRDLVIYLQAESLFTDLSAQGVRRQLGILKDWHAHHDVGALFVFSPDRLKHLEMAKLKRLFSGIAQIQTHADTMTWRTYFWRGRQRGNDASSYAIWTRGNGSLYALDNHQHSVSATIAAEDEDVVMSTRDTLMEGTPPSNWRVFEDKEQLLGNAFFAHAASVIINYSHDESFEEVAHQIHSLRLNCGRRIKILVREVGVRIHYDQETLLYHLGANRLIRGSSDLSGMFRMAASLKGHVFGRAIVADFDDFMAKSNPGEHHGYMTPMDFSAAAAEFLRCGINTGAACALVKLKMRNDRSHLSILAACHVDRTGIFITVDETWLYLFLFACPTPDVDALIATMLSQPQDELFIDSHVLSVPGEIDAELQRMLRQTEFAGFTDFTEYLSKHAAQPDEPEAAIVAVKNSPETAILNYWLLPSGHDSTDAPLKSRLMPISIALKDTP